MCNRDGGQCAELGVQIETGWDLGPFAAMLQCLHLDTRLPEQQNTKKLYGTKNNCVHACTVGANSGPKRYKKTTKPNCHL